MSFTEVHTRLSAYLKTSFEPTASASAEAAERLFHPRLLRALFGVDVLAESFDLEPLSPTFDLKPVRKAVADLIASLPKRQGAIALDWSETRTGTVARRRARCLT